jgi:hypothetical protein
MGSDQQVVTHGKRRRLFAMALVLAAFLFFLHATLLIEVADVLPAVGAWLRDRHSPLGVGKVIVLGCFVLLFVAHFAEAAAWGFFLLAPWVGTQLFGWGLFCGCLRHLCGLRGPRAPRALAPARAPGLHQRHPDVRLLHYLSVPRPPEHLDPSHLRNSG